VRELALANPLLSFDSILFVKRAPTMFPHMSDQHYGWWSRGGGGFMCWRASRPARRGCVASPAVCRKELRRAGPFFRRTETVVCLRPFSPGLSGEKNKADKTNVPADAFYHIYEIGVDGTGLRQLTSANTMISSRATSRRRHRLSFDPQGSRPPGYGHLLRGYALCRSPGQLCPVRGRQLAACPRVHSAPDG